MDGQKFDSLARLFAGGMDRRSALKTIGASVVAVAAPLIGHSVVHARDNDCAHFCNAAFPPGPARGKCKSDAAKHVPGNLCDACSGDLSNVCAGANGVVTCCGTGETCNPSSGSCAPDVCIYQDCLEANGPNAACCGERCGLIALSACDPDNDLCCGTLTGIENGDFCKLTPNSPSGLAARCCIPTDEYPCSGTGGSHCAPNAPCDTCCSDLCGPITVNGNAYCVNSLS